MSLDYIDIIICVTLLVFAFVTPFVNPFFRKLKEQENSKDMDAMPPVSVIIYACDNAEELKSNLPLLLFQNYPAGFEVIVVVDDKTEHETNIILEQYSSNPNLYTTFLPKTSRYMSRRKLAITIGVKAAKHEWILLTDAGCKPLSENWLATMARNCDDCTNIVIGYSNYSDNAKSFWRFERLRDELYCMQQAQNGIAYRSGSNNLMFRKSDFMNGRGFEGNLKYIRGEYDFIINKYAKKGGTAIELCSEAWIEEDTPTRKTWKDKHLFNVEIQKHLSNGTIPRLMHALDTTAMSINYALIIVSAVYSLNSMNVFTCAACLLALLITILLRSFIAAKVIKRFNARTKLWKTVFHELNMLVHIMTYRVLHILSDKNDFICHKM